MLAFCRFFYLCILACLGCQNSSNLQIKRDNSPSKLRREIPGDYNGSFYINSFFDLPRKLRMKELYNGFEDLQIRIWYDESFRDTVNVISLTLVDGKWTAEVRDIALLYDGVNNYQEVRVKDTILIKQPKSNWKTIEKAIIDNDILNLPDFQDIPGYAHMLPTDGNVFTVEVADKNNYRIYAYPSPGSYNYRNFEPVTKFVRFRDLLEREFDFLRS
mgnify:CR=1 FL=1